jgi:hypothetical protein
MLDGTLVLNPANKLSAYHGFEYGKCNLNTALLTREGPPLMSLDMSLE